MNPSIRDRALRPGSESWDWPETMPDILRQVFARRDIRDPRELNHELGALKPVGRFSALATAADLLHAHRDRNVVIVGDFDADGATSAALMQLCLGGLGFASVSALIPDRFEMGYGLTPEAVHQAFERDPTLIVTVDNGITSLDGIRLAREHGIDVLITDHHLPGSELPQANAIVNPNLPSESFSAPHLAGVGVVFYLLAALGKRFNAAPRVAGFLDLVALGTMADVVPLDQNNRILVQQGLARIRAGRCRPGIRALFQVAGKTCVNAHAQDLAFQIAPRLNAAGRLEDMSTGVRCLVTEDLAEALELAERLDSLNRERRDIESRMQEQANNILGELSMDSGELPAAIVLAGENWHQGVVGLVASRVKDRVHRPVFAFAPAGDGELKGSGRSIPGFHLRDALTDIAADSPGLMTRFGGHAMAAGLTIKSSALSTFAAALERAAQRRLGCEDLSPTVLTDGELAAEDINLEIARLVRDAAPWGQQFPEPTFRGRFQVLSWRVAGERHLKMEVRHEDGINPIDAIAFGCGSRQCEEGDWLQLVYRLDINHYRDYPAKLQLIVEHIQPAS